MRDTRAGVGMLALALAIGWLVGQNAPYVEAQNAPAAFPVEWERQPKRTRGGGHTVQRSKVPGGWLVTTISWHDNPIGAGVCFVPDLEHSWDWEPKPIEPPKNRK